MKALLYFLAVIFKYGSEAKLPAALRSDDYSATPSANKLGPLFYVEPPTDVYFSNDTGIYAFLVFGGWEVTFHCC